MLQKIAQQKIDDYVSWMAVTSSSLVSFLVINTVIGQLAKLTG